MASRGSISAEHGIGTEAGLHLNRCAAEIEMFRWLKHALEPAGILNPDAVLPDPRGVANVLREPLELLIRVVGCACDVGFV